MNQSGNSKIRSEFPMAFPPYRPSHFRSQTYNTLVRIFSHLSPSTVPPLPLNVPGTFFHYIYFSLFLFLLLLLIEADRERK
jgi:hypothetical protein